MRAENRAVLIRSIALGRRWLDEVTAGRADLDAIAIREERSRRHVEQMVSLAFLDPHLIKAIVDGCLPRGTSLRRLIDPPLAWSAQWQRRGSDSARPADWPPDPPDGHTTDSAVLDADRERVECWVSKQSGEPAGTRFGVTNEAGDRLPLLAKSGTRMSAETAKPAEAPS